MAIRLPNLLQQLPKTWRCSMPVARECHRTFVSSTFIENIKVTNPKWSSALLINHGMFLQNSIQIRSYAKKGKKDKGKKSGNKPTVELSEEELTEIIDFHKFEHQLENVLLHLKQDYIEKLSLRTSAGVFDNLIVDTPDGKFPLIQLGQVVQKNPQLIVINLTSVPQYISNVKSAIEESGMNLNPQQDGTTLFVPVPKVTREHREGMAKNAKMLCDKAKEKIKHIHNTFFKDAKKAKDHHSEDLIRGVQEHIDVTSKTFAKQADDLLHVKQNELLGK